MSPPKSARLKGAIKDGKVIQDNDESAETWLKYWLEHFANVDQQFELIDEYLEKLTQKFNAEQILSCSPDLILPDRAYLQEVNKPNQNFKCGPDGANTAMFHAAGESFAERLFKYLKKALTNPHEDMLPKDMNLCRLFLLPKGDKAEIDEAPSARSGEKTRPRSSMHALMKILSILVAKTMAAISEKTIANCQRGLVPK